MTRTERLSPIIKYNDEREHKALLEVAESKGVLEREQIQLQQLEAYRVEYYQGSVNNQTAVSSYQMQEYNRFLAQLDTTIKSQKQVIQQRQRELDRKRHEWTETRIDASAIHKVAENIDKKEQLAANRQEQKLSDEFSQRKFTR